MKLTTCLVEQHVVQSICSLYEESNLIRKLKLIVFANKPEEIIDESNSVLWWTWICTPTSDRKCLPVLSNSLSMVLGRQSYERKPRNKIRILVVPFDLRWEKMFSQQKFGKWLCIIQNAWLDYRREELLNFWSDNPRRPEETWAIRFRM
jgi:hypothetical protein